MGGGDAWRGNACGESHCNPTVELFKIYANVPTHIQPEDRLDPKVKAIKTEELTELKGQLEVHNRAEMEKKLAKRYHHVSMRETQEGLYIRES